jgi:hypothetical protein
MNRTISLQWSNHSRREKESTFVLASIRRDLKIRMDKVCMEIGIRRENVCEVCTFLFVYMCVQMVERVDLPLDRSMSQTKHHTCVSFLTSKILLDHTSTSEYCHHPYNLYAANINTMHFFILVVNTFRLHTLYGISSFLLKCIPNTWKSSWENSTPTKQCCIKTLYW